MTYDLVTGGTEHSKVLECMSKSCDDCFEHFTLLQWLSDNVVESGVEQAVGQGGRMPLQILM